MKPSERIEEIRQKLIREDWVRYGGNLYSSEGWQQICDNNTYYTFKAIVMFLDETQHLPLT